MEGSCFGYFSRFFGEARTDRDLILSITLSALPRPECFWDGGSTSTLPSLFLFRNDDRSGGILSTSISVLVCFCFCCYWCCCCFWCLCVCIWFVLILLFVAPPFLDVLGFFVAPSLPALLWWKLLLWCSLILFLVGEGIFFLSDYRFQSPSKHHWVLSPLHPPLRVLQLLLLLLLLGVELQAKHV